jgi:hypothetical protein
LFVALFRVCLLASVVAEPLACHGWRRRTHLQNSPQNASRLTNSASLLTTLGAAQSDFFSLFLLLKPEA